MGMLLLHQLSGCFDFAGSVAERPVLLETVGPGFDIMISSSTSHFINLSMPGPTFPTLDSHLYLKSELSAPPSTSMFRPSDQPPQLSSESCCHSGKFALDCLLLTLEVRLERQLLMEATMPEPMTYDPMHYTLNSQFPFNEKETKTLREALQRKSTVTLDDLRRIALWKLDRVVEVPDQVLQSLQKLATSQGLTADSSEAKEVLLALVKCPGVGFPMASAFLKFLRPDVFPIIDVRAYRALFGKKLYPQMHNLDRYLCYVRHVQEIAERTGLPLHEVDEQLYCFDKKFNGKI